MAPDASDRQEYFRVRRIEVLRGDLPPEAFEFFPHAEGFPSFRAGDRALVFLERSRARPEFARLAGRFPWFSVQEEGEEWKLQAAEGEATLAMARGYAGLPDAAEAEWLPRLRALVARGLGSPFASLRADARSELIALRGARGFFGSGGDVAPLAALVASPAIPFPERVSLARLLDGTPGFDAARAFRSLAAQAKSREDTLALVRVFATSGGPEVARWVAERLADPDPRVRREAALALGRARRAGDVAALARAAADPDEGVARAALGSLGAIGDPAAREALRAVREGGVARRSGFAAAELRRLEQHDRAEAARSRPASEEGARGAP